MRYLMMVKGPENAGPPPQGLIDAIAKLGEEGFKSGVLVETGGLGPSSLGARVRVSGGKISVTDGPFSEAKELVGGYAVYELKSKDEAIEYARRFMEVHAEHWPEWEGETELREVVFLQ
jgi:hypothetical protein